MVTQPKTVVQKLAAIFASGREFTVADLVRKTNASEPAVRHALDKLQGYGLVQAVNEGTHKIRIYRKAGTA